MSQTVFDGSKVTVLFVLGGPGAGLQWSTKEAYAYIHDTSAGKGTQCAELVKEFRFCHLSGIPHQWFFLLSPNGSHSLAGDLLRAEQDREGSRYGDLIKSYIKDGQIVPMEVTIKLLENAMTDALKAAKKDSDGWSDGHGRFLIDGFPRKMDQAEKFEQEVCAFDWHYSFHWPMKQVCPSSLTIFFDTSEEVLLKRLTKRGETSGRADDNPETIKKRFSMISFTGYIMTASRVLRDVHGTDYARDRPLQVDRYS